MTMTETRVAFDASQGSARAWLLLLVTFRCRKYGHAPARLPSSWMPRSLRRSALQVAP
jgi:hypothetical protein